MRRVLRHGPLWTRQLPETGIKPILKIYSTICAFLVCYMTHIQLLYEIHWTIFCGERKSSIFNWLVVQQAKAMGTKLIVGVHTDAEIAKHKVGKPGNLIRADFCVYFDKHCWQNVHMKLQPFFHKHSSHHFDSTI